VAFLTGRFAAAEVTPTVFVMAAESDDPLKESALTMKSIDEQTLTSLALFRFTDESFIRASRGRRVENGFAVDH
jgi:hypothetical protein